MKLACCCQLGPCCLGHLWQLNARLARHYGGNWFIECVCPRQNDIASQTRKASFQNSNDPYDALACERPYIDPTITMLHRFGQSCCYWISVHSNQGSIHIHMHGEKMCGPGSITSHGLGLWTALIVDSRASSLNHPLICSWYCLCRTDLESIDLVSLGRKLNKKFI